MFIVYVRDQDASTRFYGSVFQEAPSTHEPGMTEFALGDGVSLGLMPAAGIRRLLGDALPDPDAAAGIPRCELYLVVPDAAACLQRALDAGARALSPLLPRDWGQRVGYCLDPDGHVLAFAEGGDVAEVAEVAEAAESAVVGDVAEAAVG